MSSENSADLRTAAGEELVRLIQRSPPRDLLPILDNPALDEAILAMLLQRRDLLAEFLESVVKRRHLIKGYQVKKLLAFHPNMPRTEGTRLLRDLYLMDLVRFSIAPGVLPDLKRKAEDQVIAKMPQLPLGQKITLARRSPARIAGSLLADGQPSVVKAALGNPNLTEAQVLRVLAKDKLPPSVVQAISQDPKWSHVYNVRIALVRQTSTPLATVLAFLPELTVSDLRELVSPGILPENLRQYLQAEIALRMRESRKKADLLVGKPNSADPSE